MKSPSLLLTLVITMVSSLCAAQQQRATNVPAFITKPATCALVYSAIRENAFADSKASFVWIKFTQQAVDQMVNHMQFDQLKVQKILTSGSESPDMSSSITKELVRTQCNLFVELSSLASIDAEGPYVEFTSQVMHAGLDSGSGQIKIVGDYSRKYRFKITDELLHKLFPGEFAEVVYADLLKTDVLSTIRENR